MIKLSSSLINYLYVINTLENPTITKIAKSLNYQKPSVVNAIKSLEELKMLTYDNRKITLTSLGKKYADNYNERKKAMVTFLVEVLKIDESVARNDARKIMQVVSCQTTVALNNYLKDNLNIDTPDMKDYCLNDCDSKINV